MYRIFILLVYIFVASCANNTLNSKNIKFTPQDEFKFFEMEMLPYTGWPVITVKLNGVEDVRCLLDTGANINQLFMTDKLSSLKFKFSGSDSIWGYGNGPRLPVNIVRNVSLGLKDGELSGLDFRASSVNDIIWLTPDGSIDCILGYDIFKKFAVEIDHKNKKITFHPRLNPEKKRGSIAVPLLKSSNPPFLREVVADLQLSQDTPPIHGRFLLDTGQRSAVIYYIEESEAPKSAKASVVGGNQGLADAWKLRAASLSLGGHNFTDPKATLINSSSRIHRRRGAIGSAVLNKGRYIISYNDNELYFFPYETTSDLFEKSASETLYFTLSRNYPIVFRQNRKAPKEISAVKAGSRITRLNGRDTRTLTDEERNRIIYGLSGPEFNFCYQEFYRNSAGWGPENCVMTTLDLD